MSADLANWKLVGPKLLLRVIRADDVDEVSGLTKPEDLGDDDAPQTTLGEIVMTSAEVGTTFAVGQQVIVLKTWARVLIDDEEFIVCDAHTDVLMVKEIS